MLIALYVLTHLAGLAAATWWLDGMAFSGAAGGGEAEFYAKIGPLLLIAAILGSISGALKPATKFLTWPMIVLTLGVYLFGLNTLMIVAVAWISEHNDFAFRIGGFQDALWGAAIISAFTVGMQLMAGKD